MKGRNFFGVNLVAETTNFCTISLLSTFLICMWYIPFDIRLRWFSEQSFILLFRFNRNGKPIRELELVVGNIPINISFPSAFHTSFALSYFHVLHFILFYYEIHKTVKIVNITSLHLNPCLSFTCLSETWFPLLLSC